MSLPLPAVVPRLRRRTLLAGLGAGLGLAGLTASAPALAAAPLGLPPLPLRLRTLANGLQVASVADHRHATLAIQVWYRVGGKDDPPGRSGFAHLFEHMMFKRTRHLPDEMFDRLTEDVGGQNNAFTAEDMTVYQNEVPSNHGERLLWAEAERMANLAVTQASFDSERQVVIEEYRERVLADPYGRLFNALPGLAFEQHPYRRPVIGNIEELQAATLADVQAFHAAYYRPDNALLIVVGDIEPERLDGWVDRYFGALPRPEAPPPRRSVTEPRRRADRRARVTAPRLPLPAVALLWQGVPAGHADAPALQIAAALLAAGDSARLNERLVYRAQAAQAAGFSADGYAEAGMIAAYAVAAHRQPLARLQTLLLREIERLASGPIPEAELDKVRTRLLTAALRTRQTPAGLAQAIGEAALLRGDPRDAERELQRLQAVGAGDVQRVLRQHVLQAHRVTVEYVQEGA